MTGAEFRGVDVDLLADYIGGALAGTLDESVVATLIADDPAWRSAYESLSGDMAAVEAELGRFEAEPMPDDIAARLDAALADAGKRQLTLIHGDGAPRVREKRKSRWVTPIAIAAGAVAFVGFGLDYLAGLERGSADKSATSSAAGTAEDRQDSAEAPAMASAQPDLAQPYDQPDASAGKAAAPKLLYTGRDYTEATLAEANGAEATGADPPPRPLTAPESLASARALGRLATPAGREQCLAKIAEANGAASFRAEVVDYAKFDGMPAIVVRFTASNGTWVWASGPACGTPGGGADTRARVTVR